MIVCGEGQDAADHVFEGRPRTGQRSTYVWEAPLRRQDLPPLPAWLLATINNNGRLKGTKGSVPKPLRTSPANGAALHPAEAKGNSWDESDNVVEELVQLVADATGGDKSARYAGTVQLRSCVSHQFRNCGARRCPYGESHVRNNFSLLEQNLLIRYRCHSKECKGEDAIGIGKIHARILVDKPQDQCRFQSRVIRGLLGDCRDAPPSREALADAMRYANTYFAMVRMPSLKTVEIVYHDGSCAKANSCHY